VLPSHKTEFHQWRDFKTHNPSTKTPSNLKCTLPNQKLDEFPILFTKTINNKPASKNYMARIFHIGFQLVEVGPYVSKSDC
jgi:hypothetical protein